MARPKGSKNKTVEVEAPREFDYERDDTAYDGTYQINPAVATTTATAQPWSMAGLGTSITSAEARPYTPEPIVSAIPAYHGTQTLFLVEGDVQLSSREAGRGSMVAKQTRIVRAGSDAEAVQKYSIYFRGLSDTASEYTVIRAAAMEVID